MLSRTAHRAEHLEPLERPGDAEPGPTVRADVAQVRRPAGCGRSGSACRPQIALNRVVFPAPFGPISPVIPPASTSSSTWSNARTPPKCTSTCSTSRRATGHTENAFSPAGRRRDRRLGGPRMEQLSFRRTLVVFIGLQLGQVMSSIDGTIVATALPTIVDDVGGLLPGHLGGERVLVGDGGVDAALREARRPLRPAPSAARGHRHLPRRLGGLRGPRRRWISCSWPGSCRASAAGASAAVAMATVADIVPARQLGRWLGYQGVMFAVASAIGPIVGGLFVDHLSCAGVLHQPPGRSGRGRHHRHPAA